MNVVDAHAHVWDPRVLRYPWLAGVPALNRPRLPEAIDDAGGRITQWVFVEADPAASDAAAEIAWVRRQAWLGLRAVVAQANAAAELGSVATHPPGDAPVRGIRHMLQAYDGMPWPADLAAGLSTLADRGLVFDACVAWTQLPSLAKLLRTATPLPVVVLDHAGKPPVDEGLASADGQQWLGGMRQLAALPGVHVKLSGLPAETSSPAALRRHGPAFVRAVLEMFGAERCLFGSDWPVSAVGGIGTGEWLDIVTDVVAAFDAAAESDVLAGTARRVYRLGASIP